MISKKHVDLLNFKDQGNGEPVVIIHGLFGMLDNWHRFAKSLSDEYRVITVDVRNHGKSFHSNIFDYPTAAKDIADLLQYLEIDNAHIIGHSMGGKIAMQLASDFANLLDHLVIIDIAPVDYPRGHDSIFNALLALDLTTLSSRNQAEEELLQLIPDSTVVQFLLKSLSRSATGFSWKTNLVDLYKSYDIIRKMPPIGDIHAPTALLYGTQSEYINATIMAHTIELIPQIEIHALDAGHWIHAEKPSELLDIIKTFLAA